MKHWNLGNTTVRNPDRIKEGLIVLKKYFEGKPFTESEQLSFFEALVKEKVIETKKLSTGSKEISGRKWASCFNQLGFAVAWKTKGNIVITDAGNSLISQNAIEEEIFLRQLLKYKLPSSIERGKDYAGFDVNPLFVILSVLNKIEREDIGGLTKEEIALFVVTCIRNSDINTAIENILNYRRGRGKIKGRVQKKEYYHINKVNVVSKLFNTEIIKKRSVIKKLIENTEKDKDFLNKTGSEYLIKTLTSGGKGSNTKRAIILKQDIIQILKNRDPELLYDKILGQYINIKGKTLEDYADTTVRYTTKTGLLSISGERLIIKTDKKAFVENLVNKFTPEDYGPNNEYFYSSTLPKLPTDNVDFLRQDVSRLYSQLTDLQKQLSVPPNSGFSILGITKETKSNALKVIRQGLELQISKLKEVVFYSEQSKQDKIKEILDYYDKITNRELLGGDAYLPAYLEWTTWRVFLAINNIINEISETRGFSIDEELNPIHHAKGNDADMLFEYSDFVIVCEVTLLKGDNQWAEDEPVPRHVAKIISRFNKNVFGVFIAPSISPNTVLEFYDKKRVVNGQMRDIRIMPLTIDQIKGILIKFSKNRFPVQNLKMLFEELLNSQSKDVNALDWYAKANQQLVEWIKK